MTNEPLLPLFNAPHDPKDGGVNQVPHPHSKQHRVSIDQIHAWRLERQSLRVQLALVRLRIERDRLKRIASHVG